MKNNNKFFDNYYLIIDFRFGNWINKLIKINCKYFNKLNGLFIDK